MKITYKGITKECKYYKGLVWNKPLTPEMLIFQKETNKNPVRGGKLTGTFEYWMYWDSKRKKSNKRTITKQKPKQKPKIVKIKSENEIYRDYMKKIVKCKNDVKCSKFYVHDLQGRIVEEYEQGNMSREVADSLIKYARRIFDKKVEKELLPDTKKRVVKQLKKRSQVDRQKNIKQIRKLVLKNEQLSAIYDNTITEIKEEKILNKNKNYEKIKLLNQELSKIQSKIDDNNMNVFKLAKEINEHILYKKIKMGLPKIYYIKDDIIEGKKNNIIVKNTNENKRLYIKLSKKLFGSPQYSFELYKKFPKSKINSELPTIKIIRNKFGIEKGIEILSNTFIYSKTVFLNRELMRSIMDSWSIERDNYIKISTDNRKILIYNVTVLVDKSKKECIISKTYYNSESTLYPQFIKIFGKKIKVREISY